MRSVSRLAAALFALVVLVLALTLALRSNGLAFTLGVSNGGAVAPLRPGQQACQGVIVVPEEGTFDRVRFSVGTFFRPGPPLAVTVKEDQGRVLGRGRLPGGYADIARTSSQTVRVGEVGVGRRVTVCIANEGTRNVAVYGNAGIASRTTSATVAGKSVDADLNLAFETKPRSIASLWPAIADRAALFRAQLVGPWTYALLAALVLLAVPALLARALVAAAREAE
jgi:hypothetical protein